MRAHARAERRRARGDTQTTTHHRRERESQPRTCATRSAKTKEAVWQKGKGYAKRIEW